jgi:DNA-binding transcriptional ArsR family regulator
MAADRSKIVQGSVDSLRSFVTGQIYLDKYILGLVYMSMQSVFDIIAEPNRRAILRLLASSQQSVGDLERELRLPQPTVSKHLRVLREAGFVEPTVDAQRRLYHLNPQRLQELDEWLAPFRRFWAGHLDALERHLDRIDEPSPTRRIKEKTDDRSHAVRPGPGRRSPRP